MHIPSEGKGDSLNVAVGVSPKPHGGEDMAKKARLGKKRADSAKQRLMRERKTRKGEVAGALSKNPDVFKGIDPLTVAFFTAKSSEVAERLLDGANPEELKKLSRSGAERIDRAIKHVDSQAVA